MKRNIIIYNIFLVIAVLGISGCVKDFADPNRATDESVSTSVEGLTGVAVSLQSRYTEGRSNIYNPVTASGFLTKELFLLNQGNTAEFQLSVGGTVLDGSNAVTRSLWSNSNKILYDSEFIIKNIGVVTDKNYASGMLGYVTIFRALATGDLANLWEQIPAGTGENQTFIPRIDAYKRAVSDIDAALAAISANAISSTFLSRIPAGIDIPNTLQALKARYALFAGDLPVALSAANAVDLTKKSQFNFDAISPNPIFTAITNSNNIYQPVDDNLGLPVALRPDAGDKRIPFYLTQNPTVAPLWRVGGFGKTITTSWPVYLPGEMTLIKAEVYARQATPNLAASLTEINKIVTKKPAADPFGVGADLAPLTGSYTQSQLLAEIYKQRSLEMVMSGLRLEDSRRLGRPTAERLRNFAAYPFAERDQNPNTPADPAF